MFSFVYLNLNSKKMATHNELGQLGEDLALKHLLEKGYRLLARNFRFKHLEIDLIMQDEDKLVFVEVKTRQTAEIGEPYLAVTRTKQKQIIKVANWYIIENDLHNESRFDIVSIVHNSYRTAIEHIENAFTP
jgi:putative endonuclease